jgi:hypothetical protein
MRHWKIISAIAALLGDGAIEMSGFTCPPLSALLGLIAAALLIWSAWPTIQKVVSTRPVLKDIIFVVVVLGIIAAIAFLVVRPLIIQSPTPTATEEWQWSHPSPQEIWQDINSQNPYLQDATRESYEGLSVEWGVTLSSVHECPEWKEYPKGVDVWSYPVGHSTPAVSFTLNSSLYPEIKSMKPQQQFVVQGTITEVTTICIRLDNCHVIVGEGE